MSIIRKCIEKSDVLNTPKVTLPSSLESVDARAFGELIEEIDVEKENDLFYTVNGALLTKSNTLIFLPKNHEIPECTEIIASYSCRFLESCELVLPKNIKEIQYMGFAGSKIKSVICNDNLKKIGSNAFDSLNFDTGIKSIKLNCGLVEICDNAFAGTLLTEIFIPKSVSSIGVLPFDIRGKLNKIEVDADNSRYSSDASNSIIEKRNDKLIVGCKKTVIPKSVKEIGEKAFYSCGMSSVKIPNSVIAIGDYCFASNKLKSVDISNVEHIGVGAFANNSDLQNIIFSNKVKSLPANIVSGCDNLKAVELPNNIELVDTDTFSNFMGSNIIISDSVKVIKTRAISSECAAIVYKGTKKQWLDIIGGRNIYYNDSGNPTQPKNYSVECLDGVLDVEVVK